MSEARLIDIAVLVSGTGSNLRAIVDAIEERTCAARVVGVLSDRKSAAALEFAADKLIPTKVVPLRKGDDRERWNELVAEAVQSWNPRLVVLAGFMRVLGPPLIDAFSGRVINVHPALLPSFPGHDATEQAIAAGVRISGCTVHVVDHGVDTGPIIAQTAVPVLWDDTPSSLHKRIQVEEHRLLPQVINEIATGAIQLDPLSLK